LAVRTTGRSHEEYVQVYAADDESNQFRGALRRRNTLPLLLLAFAGIAAGLLILAPRLSPRFAALLPWHAEGVNKGLELPFLAQLALAFMGLAALVMVLVRAVRSVDTHPYASIAPVLAVFAGLVHMGLRVDLPGSGLSSMYLAGGVISVALMGGALVGRERLSAQLLGWTLVLLPSVLVSVVMALADGKESVSLAALLALKPSVRVFLQLLGVSALLLGLTGVVARRLLRGAQRSAYETSDSSPSWSRGGAAASVDRDDAGARWSSRGLGPALQLTAALLAVAAGTYWAVDRLRHSGGDTTAASSAAPTPVLAPGAPVVEQLGAAAVASPAVRGTAASPNKRQRASKHDKSSGETSNAKAAAASSSIERPGREPAAEHLDKSHAAAKRASAPSQPVQGAGPRGARSSGLPAWGTEATSTSEPATPKANKRALAVAAEPAASVPSKPAQAAPSKAAAAAESKPATTFASKPAAPVASKPVALASTPPTPPPKPAAPEKPLTMDQLLNKVVEVASEAKPRKAGTSEPKSQRDMDLDLLLNSAVKNPKGK
jgi:hypothetical protein